MQFDRSSSGILPEVSTNGLSDFADDFEVDDIRPSRALRTVKELLAYAGIGTDGVHPWDIRIHDSATAERVLGFGSLGLGESYMDGWWDCEALDEFFYRIMRSGLDMRVGKLSIILQAVRARIINLQNARRAWRVGQLHYDAGNDIFSAMLDSHMTYTCGYWANATTLEEAQQAKLDLICRKLELLPGMRLLDIGCGWGSLMQFAATHYGVECVGLTISNAQVELGRERLAHLPIEFRLTDYRAFNIGGSEKFDRIASVGMFEHVGRKNYRSFFEVIERSIVVDGLFLLHTIGKRRRSGGGSDAWMDRYIFPGGALPCLGELVDSAQKRFVVEDVHNFGADYDRTLMAWYGRFEDAWPSLSEKYGERFHRMWRYYLLSCAGAFRARDPQLFQIVGSPLGVAGGYRRP